MWRDGCTRIWSARRSGATRKRSTPWRARWATDACETFPLEFGQPYADWLSDPILESDLFLIVASQPIGDSTPDEWAAKQMAGEEGCAATEAITVGGAGGLIGAEGCDVVVVTTADRGYWLLLYTSGDDPSAVVAYDRAWFEEVLAGVQLRPEDAVDRGPSPDRGSSLKLSTDAGGPVGRPRRS